MDTIIGIIGVLAPLILFPIAGAIGLLLSAALSDDPHMYEDTKAVIMEDVKKIQSVIIPRSAPKVNHDYDTVSEAFHDYRIGKIDKDKFNQVKNSIKGHKG